MASSAREKIDSGFGRTAKPLREKLDTMEVSKLCMRQRKHTRHMLPYSYLPPPRSPIPPTNRLFSSSLSSSSFLPLKRPWILLIFLRQLYSQHALFNTSAGREHERGSSSLTCKRYRAILIIIDPNALLLDFYVRACISFFFLSFFVVRCATEAFSCFIVRV